MALGQSFVWGDGGAQLTPEQIAANRKVSEALLEKGMDYSPVLSKWQGLARVSQALMGGYESYRSDQADKTNRDADQKMIASLLMPQTSPAAGPPAAPPAAAPPADAAPTGVAPPETIKGIPLAPPPSSNFMPNVASLSAPAPASPPAVAPGMDANAKAISGIESGGRYDLQGPVTRSGDRAYGKYQVMGSNVGPWTKQYFGQELTPQQFLASPEAQDAVFKGEFGRLAGKHGPEGAARAWFAGEGGMNDPNRKDILGTTVANYGQKFSTALNGGSPAAAAPAAPVATTPAPTAPMAVPMAAPATAAPAPVAAQPPGGGALSGVNPALIQALTSPYAGEGVKKVAALLLQQQMGDKVTYQTTPDGDVLAMDPHGRAPPKVVYQATPKPIAVPENSQLWDPRTKTFINPSPPVTSITGADGKQIPIPAGQDPKKFREHVTIATADASAGKLTEVQSNATQFANRMEDATKNIDKLEPDVTSGGLGTFKDRVARGITEGGYNPIPRGATNWAVSEGYQSYEQAKSQFITALLRKESGAAISQSEFDRYSKEFFPTMGDSAEVIAQKKQARSVALEAMKKSAGPIYQSPKDPASAAGPSVDDLVKKYSK